MEEARKARKHATTGFLDAVDLGVQVRRVTSSLHNHAERNHWGEGLEAVWQQSRRMD